MSFSDSTAFCIGGSRTDKKSKSVIACTSSILTIYKGISAVFTYLFGIMKAIASGLLVSNTILKSISGIVGICLQLLKREETGILEMNGLNSVEDYRAISYFWLIVIFCIFTINQRLYPH
jgi:hypothetical protein